MRAFFLLHLDTLKGSLVADSTTQMMTTQTSDLLDTIFKLYAEKQGPVGLDVCRDDFTRLTTQLAGNIFNFLLFFSGLNLSCFV